MSWHSPPCLRTHTHTHTDSHLYYIDILMCIKSASLTQKRRVSDVMEMSLNRFRTRPTKRREIVAVWPDVLPKCSPISTRSWPKDCHSSFYLKSVVFKLAQKVNKIFGLLLKEYLSLRTFLKNRPIWSHWVVEQSRYIVNSRY